MDGNLNARAEAETGNASNRSMVRTRRTRINRALTAAEIGILIGVIVLFNAFPEKVGIYNSAVEPYLFIPLLTPAWLSYMPWLNIWWGLALTLALVKLVHGCWTQALRWADLGLHLLGICVLASLILGGAIGGVDSGGPGTETGASTWVRQNPDLLLVGFKSGLVLALVAMTAVFFSKLARLGVVIPVLQWRIDWFKR
jgi:hypothetical protein